MDVYSAPNEIKKIVEVPIGALWGVVVVTLFPWLEGGVGCEWEIPETNIKAKLNRIFVFISIWFSVDKYDFQLIV